MAKPIKKSSPSKLSQASKTSTASKSAASASPVRNSPVPKSQPAKKEITQAQIAKRAYEIFLRGKGGTERDHWFQAERELRGM